MSDQQLRLFREWGPQNERERQVGKSAIAAIKGNLRSMSGPDPRFLGTEQRKRMGAESSHVGMIESGDQSKRWVQPNEHTHRGMDDPWPGEAPEQSEEEGTYARMKARTSSMGLGLPISTRRY
jgi:hypothetical protein